MVTVKKRGTTLRGFYYIDSDEASDRILMSVLQTRQLFSVSNRRMHIFSTSETEQGSLTFQIKNTV